MVLCNTPNYIICQKKLESTNEDDFRNNDSEGFCDMPRKMVTRTVHGHESDSASWFYLYWQGPDWLAEYEDVSRDGDKAEVGAREKEEFE